MQRLSQISSATMVVVLAASPAWAAPVDLSSWTAEGGGSWTVAADKNSVFQSINGTPTVFYSSGSGQGQALSGKIKVEQNGGDDDFIGFVLGFQPGDISAGVTDYILVDWKQGNQSFFGCQGQAGLAISRVTAGAPDGAPSWCHTGSTTVLQRAATLGTTGWADNTEYSFDLIFTATNIQVKVNGQTELNVSGSFADGSFGFYNYSQALVRYSAITQDTAPPTNGVPEPASLGLAALALLGLAGARRARNGGR